MPRRVMRDHAELRTFPLGPPYSDRAPPSSHGRVRVPPAVGLARRAAQLAPDRLAIPGELANALTEWSDEYTATLNWSNPKAPGFRDNWACQSPADALAISTNMMLATNNLMKRQDGLVRPTRRGPNHGCRLAVRIRPIHFAQKANGPCSRAATHRRDRLDPPVHGGHRSA